MPRAAGLPRWAIFFIGWAVLSILSACWAVATPIGGAPDEPAHLIKAASVVRGEWIGTSTADGQRVTVPAYVAYTPAQTCYAYNDMVTPACSAPFSGDPARPTVSSTTAGLYNPTYYLLVGWPTLIDQNESGVYFVRVVSGILSSAFLALALMMISTWPRRRIPLLGFAVLATPMVFFLNGVVNPNSLETTASLAAFVGVCSIVAQPSRRLLVERAVITMVSAAIAVNTRGLSPLWVAIAVLLPFLLASGAQIRELASLKVIRVAVIVIGVAAAAAVIWILGTNSLGGGLTTTSAPPAGFGVGASPLRGFTQVLVGTFDYGQGLVGVFGWLDTASPSVVLFLWSASIGSLVLIGVISLRGRPLAFVLALVGGLLLLPAITQAVYINSGGIVWQGRYALALFVCAIVGTAMLVGDRFPEIDGRMWRRLEPTVIALLAFGQAYAFAVVLKRYGVGLGSTSWKALFLNPMWSAPGGNLLNMAALTLVIAVGAVLLHRLARREVTVPHVT